MLPLYDALARSRKLRHVLARHEQGAGFIAQGIARVTGKPGVCFASSGPGATNLLTAIADAKPRLDSARRDHRASAAALIGTDAFQEVDTFASRCRSPSTTISFGRPAISLRDSRSVRDRLVGRPGPVLVDIPKDVQTAAVALPRPGAAAAPPLAAGRGHRARVRADRRGRAAHALVGGGIVHSGAAPAAVASPRSSLPTVMTLMGLGALPADHPLSLGMLGMHGAPYTNRALDECDLLIAVGARFDDRATGKLAEFCPRAAVIHVDVDASELGKLRAPELAIRADARGALAALPKLRARAPRALAPAHRRAEARHPLTSAPSASRSSAQPVRSDNAVAAAARRRDAIVTTDVGQHQMWVAQAFPRAAHAITSGGLGTMGFGLPAAIGAALAAPERTVVCFSGDGSILMNLQELATAVSRGGAK